MNYRTEHLIECYFAGTLSEAESLELKTLLDADPEAAAEFAWQKQLAQQVSTLSLSKGIQNDTWRQAAKPPFRQVNMWRTATAAAAAIALLVAAYFFIQNRNTGSTESLMAESFEHFPNKMKFKNLGGSTETISPDILDAFAEYDRKNYEEAARKLTAVVNANPTRSDFRFYLGVAFIGGKQYPNTINALLPVVQDTASTYSIPACYYLGVAYAGIKDVPQSRKYLKEYIAKNGVTYEDKAEKLLNSLK